jgi:hypothetical protein
MKYTLHIFTLLAAVIVTQSHAMNHRVTRPVPLRSIPLLNTQLAELQLPEDPSFDAAELAVSRRRQLHVSPQELQEAAALPSDRVVRESVTRSRRIAEKRKVEVGQKKAEQKLRMVRAARAKKKRTLTV